MHAQVPTATLLADCPWLHQALETLQAADIVDVGAETPDWFGLLIRATLTPYPESQAPDPAAAWTLSYPLLGTEEVPYLRGRILGYQTGREYYRTAFQGRPAHGLFRPPDCQSAEGRYGYGCQQVAMCQYCPLRRGPRCRSRGYLLLLTPAAPAPVLVLVPAKSLGVIVQSLKALGPSHLARVRQVTLASQGYTTRSGRTFPQLHLQPVEGYYSQPGDAQIGNILDGMGRRWFQILKRSLIAREQRMCLAPASAAA